MSISETFSDSIHLAGINEFDKSAVMQFSAGVRHIYKVNC